MSGSLFVVAAPSGAGKTSLVNALVKTNTKTRLSISYTTRVRREGEVHGQDYFFVSQNEFAQMRDAAAFLESATVFDHSYGTLSEAVMTQLNLGLDVILEIDWQGAKQIRINYPDCIAIFILPPSKAVLEQRLRERGQDDDETIARRMHDAKSEMSHHIEFDYLVVNDNFDEALQDLNAIIIARRSLIDIQKQDKQELLIELLA